MPAVPEQKNDSSSKDDGNIAADSSTSPYGTTSAVSTDSVDSGTSAVRTHFSQRSIHKAGYSSTTTKGTPSTIPPQETGVFRMSSNHKLQVLLTRIATQDKLYSGLEDETPASPGPSPDDWSKERPTSLPSLGEPPTPPLIKYVSCSACKIAPYRLSYRGSQGAKYFKGSRTL